MADVSHRGGSSSHATGSVSHRSAGPANVAPVASFTSVESDLEATFTDTSTDGDGTVSAWSWDFGDGYCSTVQNPVHEYAGAGTYEVTLTVTDNLGAQHSVSADVTVAAGAGGGRAEVIAALLETGFDPASLNTYQTGSVAPSANRTLYIATVAVEPVGHFAWVADVVGLGLAWKPILQVPKSVTNTNMSIWKADIIGGAPTPGVIDITLDGTRDPAVDDLLWVAWEMGGLAADRGPEQQTLVADNTASLTVELKALENAANAMLCVAFNITADMTPDANFTEIGEVYGGSRGLSVSFAIGETQSTITMASNQLRVAGLELRSADA